VLVVLLVVALAAAVAAAGGAVPISGPSSAKPLSKSSYVEQVTAIVGGVSETIGPLGSQTTPAGISAGLAQLRTRLRVADAKLGSMSPPAGIKAVHERLVRAVGELGDELGQVIVKVKSGDLLALASVVSLKGVTDLEVANAALARAGYHIPLALGL
jgi:hypothetical protein